MGIGTGIRYKSSIIITLPSSLPNDDSSSFGSKNGALAAIFKCPILDSHFFFSFLCFAFWPGNAIQDVTTCSSTTAKVTVSSPTSLASTAPVTTRCSCASSRSARSPSPSARTARSKSGPISAAPSLPAQNVNAGPLPKSSRLFYSFSFFSMGLKIKRRWNLL